MECLVLKKKFVKRFYQSLNLILGVSSTDFTLVNSKIYSVDGGRLEWSRILDVVDPDL